MDRSNESPGARLRALWSRLAPLPGGRWLFSRMLGRVVRYSGSIGPRVERFEPGDVRITLRDRAAVRNHLHSIHAIALANLGELATGLAMIGGLPGTIRGILVGIDIDYLKKARGTLVAEARCELPAVSGPSDHTVEATIRDAESDVVAIVRARWRLSPVPTEPVRARQAAAS